MRACSPPLSWGGKVRLTPALTLTVSPEERVNRSPASWKILRGDCAVTIEMPGRSAAGSFSPREKARMRGNGATLRQTLWFEIRPPLK